MAKFVFGMNQSLDGYVDHMAFAPSPTLFRHFIEEDQGQAGSVYGRHMYEVMRYWDDDHPEWDAPELLDVATRRMGNRRRSGSSARPAKQACFSKFQLAGEGTGKWQVRLRIGRLALGVGLALVRRIVEVHGGPVQVRSAAEASTHQS